MKRINLKLKIVLVYLVIVISCIAIASINNSHMYNRATIIDDRKEVIKKANMSIPIKVEFSNEIWGSCILEDENSIKNVWNSINEITSDSSTKKEHKAKVETPAAIKGNIYYLNGMKYEFQISNVFKLNDSTYCDSYKMPLINNLRNSLLNYLYSPSNLAKFINSRNEIIFMNRNGEKKKLANSDKDKLKQIIDKSIKIEDDKEIVKLTDKVENPTCHIKIYIDQEDEEYLRVKSYNVITLDIYDENFFVVQYMGDENGRHIYMKGNLRDIFYTI